MSLTPSLSLSDVTFTHLLSDDLYTTYEGIIQGKKCIVKFFTDKSDDNNETEVMTYFKANSVKPWLYPTPYFSDRDVEEYTVTLQPTGTGGSVITNTITGIFRAICYEYIEGCVLSDSSICGEKEQIRAGVGEHLQDMHSHGFVFADIRDGNILRRVSTGEYQLIDYGRVFSVSDAEFPPMEYMLDDLRKRSRESATTDVYGTPLPTQEDDFQQVETVLAKCSSID